MLLFLLAFSAICFGIVNASREIVKERAIYLHERRLCVRPGPYLASKILLLGLFSLLQSVALVALVSLKISFELNAGGITSLLAILFLGAVCGVLIGLLISALASSSDQAISIVAAVLLVQVIFSGLRPLEKMDGSIRWIAACCPSRWSYGGLCGIANVAEKLQPYASTQIHEVLQTSPENAVAALLAITTVLTAAALWAVSHRSAQGKTG